MLSSSVICQRGQQRTCTVVTQVVLTSERPVPSVRGIVWRKRSCSFWHPGRMPKTLLVSSPRPATCVVRLRSCHKLGRCWQVNNTWFVKFNVDDGAQDVVLWLRSQSFKVGASVFITCVAIRSANSLQGEAAECCHQVRALSPQLLPRECELGLRASRAPLARARSNPILDLRKLRLRLQPYCSNCRRSYERHSVTCRSCCRLASALN